MVVDIKVLLWIYQCLHQVVNHLNMVLHLMVVVIKMNKIYNHNINKMFRFKKFLHINHKVLHMLVDKCGEHRIYNQNQPNQLHIKLQLNLIKTK